MNFFDGNVVDVNGVVDLNFFDVNGVVDENSFASDFFSGFLNSIASLFSKIASYFGFKGIFSGFVGIESQEEKAFELKEKEVQVNGQTAKCFGVDCDAVPSEVD